MIPFKIDDYNDMGVPNKFNVLLPLLVELDTLNIFRKISMIFDHVQLVTLSGYLYRISSRDPVGSKNQQI